jgi:predicted nucleic acid-binding Zn ribbon protein
MSKRRDEEKWGPHSHCVVCGNAIAEDQKTCSEACAQKYDAELKKYQRNKKMNYLFIAAMGGIIVIFFVVSFLVH